VTILIPDEIDSFISEFTKEVDPLYKMLNRKEQLADDIQNRM
jgi:hypothetical protein